MTTFTEVLPARASSPHPAMNWTPGDTLGTGRLVVHTAWASVGYAIAAFLCDWPGHAFRFVKLGEGTDPEADRYDVFVGPGGRVFHCDCKGFTRWRTCEHVDSAAALIANGWAAAPGAEGRVA